MIIPDPACSGGNRDTSDTRQMWPSLDRAGKFSSCRHGYHTVPFGAGSDLSVDGMIGVELDRSATIETSPTEDRTSDPCLAETRKSIGGRPRLVRLTMSRGKSGFKGGKVHSFCFHRSAGQPSMSGSRKSLYQTIPLCRGPASCGRRPGSGKSYFSDDDSRRSADGGQCPERIVHLFLNSIDSWSVSANPDRTSRSLL